MRKLISGFFISLLFAGCELADTHMGDPTSTTLQPGTYEGIMIFKDMNLQTRQVLNQAGGYTLSAFVECEILAFDGDWSSDGKSLDLALRESRERDYCGGPLTQSTEAKTASFPIRNLTFASFEMFWPSSSQSAAQWIVYRRK